MVFPKQDDLAMPAQPKLDRERLKKLGLLELLEQNYPSEWAFQVTVARQLRKLCGDYLRGDLSEIIESGPALKIFLKRPPVSG